MTDIKPQLTIEEEIELVNSFFRYNLQLLRQSEGLSGGELSLKLGMPEKRINDLEGGRMPPRLDDLVRIADYFPITYDDLIGCKIGLKIPSQERHINNHER